jgi:hypothetical protein
MWRLLAINVNKWADGHIKRSSDSVGANAIYDAVDCP